jgi:hypothetical protein
VKVTIPVGTPDPDTAGTTVAVNVTALPFLVGVVGAGVVEAAFVEEVSFMVVALA